MDKITVEDILEEISQQYTRKLEEGEFTLSMLYDKITAEGVEVARDTIRRKLEADNSIERRPDLFVEGKWENVYKRSEK